MPEDKPAQPAFEAALAELEAVVERLEAADLPLEETLKLFERGVQLRDRCQKELAEAETRIEILVKRTKGLEPEPFEPEASR